MVDGQSLDIKSYALAVIVVFAIYGMFYSFSPWTWKNGHSGEKFRRNNFWILHIFISPKSLYTKNSNIYKLTQTGTRINDG